MPLFDCFPGHNKHYMLSGGHVPFFTCDLTVAYIWFRRGFGMPTLHGEVGAVV